MRPQLDSSTIYGNTVRYEHAAKVLSVILRVWTLLSRFLLIFSLAYFLKPSELGAFGLLSVSISYAIYLLGFDFYNFSSRQIAGEDIRLLGGMLKSQVAFFLLAYSLVLPLLTTLFWWGIVPWPLAPWFFFILVMEHIGQELNRLLVSISRPIMASIVLFLRAGVWVFFLIPLMWAKPALRGLDSVLAAWAMGVTVACILGTTQVIKIGLDLKSTKVNWDWIWRGVKVSFPLLLATLAVRGLFTFDRYFFEHLNGVELLGCYVLFIGVASAIVSFLEAGVFVFAYPALIVAFRSDHKEKFLLLMRNMRRNTLLLGGAGALLAYFLLKPFLFYLGNTFYLDNFSIFKWIVLAIFIHCISMVPHYGLYAKGGDRYIILSHATGLIVFIAGVFAISPYDKVASVPYALIMAFLVIFVIKSISFHALLKRWLAEEAES